MGFMDKLLGSMHYDDDFDDDEEYYDDDEVEEAPRKSRAMRSADMDDDYEEPRKSSRST